MTNGKGGWEGGEAWEAGKEKGEGSGGMGKGREGTAKERDGMGTGEGKGEVMDGEGSGYSRRGRKYPVAEKNCYQEWQDDYLTWNPDNYEDVAELVLSPTQIWLPDIGIQNMSDDFLPQRETRWLHCVEVPQYSIRLEALKNIPHTVLKVV